MKTRLGQLSPALVRVAFASTVLAGAADRTLAVTVTREYDIDFVTVGSPGNRGANPTEAPFWPAWAGTLGAVDHEFRIAQTNITNTQWLEFLNAYAPHYTGNQGSSSLTGFFIFKTGTQPNGNPIYQILPGAEQYTAPIEWRMAARYANWLHNAKSTDAWAFENGAYDTSTFGQVVIGGVTHLTDQVTHNPDAKFWIPTTSEYAKGAYYDPNRYGPGDEGYWIQPNGGDDQLLAGPPGVGEAAGDWLTELGIDVRSYPQTLSPWGMMDVSSTERQHTEGWIHPASGLRRQLAGSEGGSPFYLIHDMLSMIGEGSNLSPGGIRIAAAIPEPGAGILVGLWAVMSRRSRRGWC